MKKKASGVMNLSEEYPLKFRNVFGTGGAWSWLLPVDPVFEDAGEVFGWREREEGEV